MEPKIKTSLEDILCAIEEIESFFESRPLRFDVYLADLCLRRAVERNVTIIGEAMNRILKNDPEINITAARRIFRTPDPVSSHQTAVILQIPVRKTADGHFAVIVGRQSAH